MCCASAISRAALIGVILTLPLVLVGHVAAQEAAGPAASAAPRTPWGEPDLQGIWTGDALAGVPLERPSPTSSRADQGRGR